jgi:hypothetical protein
MGHLLDGGDPETRKPRPVKVSKKLRAELEAITRSRVSPAWFVQRAGFVLACMLALQKP